MRTVTDFLLTDADVLTAFRAGIGSPDILTSVTSQAQLINGLREVADKAIAAYIHAESQSAAAAIERLAAAVDRVATIFETEIAKANE